MEDAYTLGVRLNLAYNLSKKLAFLFSLQSKCNTPIFGPFLQLYKTLLVQTHIFQRHQQSANGVVGQKFGQLVFILVLVRNIGRILRSAVVLENGAHSIEGGVYPSSELYLIKTIH